MCRCPDCACMTHTTRNTNSRCIQRTLAIRGFKLQATCRRAPRNQAGWLVRTTWSISRADLPTFEVGAVSPRTARRTSAASCIEICASAPTNAAHYRAQLSTHRQAQLRAAHRAVSRNNMPEVAGTREQKRQPLASFDGIMPAKSDVILKPPLISLARVAGGINTALMSMLGILACEPIMQKQLVLACSLPRYCVFPSTFRLPFLSPMIGARFGCPRRVIGCCRSAGCSSPAAWLFCAYRFCICI